MRDILFRGKRIDNNEWVYGYLSFTYIDVKKARIYDSIEVRSYDVILNTVGEYTGINDVDGDDIFEGMTVYQKPILYSSNELDIVGKVKLYDGSWWIDSGYTAVLLFNTNCENKIVEEK